MFLRQERYIDFKEEADDGEVFEEKIKNLTAELKVQMDKSNELDGQIIENLKSIGYNPD